MDARLTQDSKGHYDISRTTSSDITQLTRPHSAFSFTLLGSDGNISIKINIHFGSYYQACHAKVGLLSHSRRYH
jgi:hypothetical protein